MKQSTPLVAIVCATVILSFGQFGFAADVRGQGNNSTPTALVPSGAMSGMDGSNGFDTVLASAPTVKVPSGAMSGMDGSNGFDTVLASAPTVNVPSGAMSGMDGSNGFDTVVQAQAPAPKNPRDAQFKLALAECAAMVSMQQSACRTSAQSAYDSNKSAPRL